MKLLHNFIKVKSKNEIKRLRERKWNDNATES